MQNNPMIMLLFGLVLSMAVLSFYPYIEGLMVDVGEEMADGANYTVSSTEADATKDLLWGVGGSFMVLAMLAYMFTSMPKQNQQQNFGG